MFDGQVKTEKIINLLYDEVARYYHVIVNIRGEMVKRYLCKACNKGCRGDMTNANRSVVIACQFFRARFPMFKYRARCAIELSGFGCVSTNIKPISYELRQCVNKRNLRRVR